LVSLYGAFVLFLMFCILVLFCGVLRCRRRYDLISEESGSSGDGSDASSDLAIVKRRQLQQQPYLARTSSSSPGSVSTRDSGASCFRGSKRRQQPAALANPNWL